jgi:hypothetical protein
MRKLFLLVGGGYIGLILSVAFSATLILLVGGGGPALPYFGIGHVIVRWRQTWTIADSCAVFIVAAFIGVLLGVIIARRYPHVVAKLCGLSVFLGIPLALCGWFLYSFGAHVETPKRLKLADCTKVTTIHLKIPKGRYYQIAFTLPTNATNGFSGHLIVSNDTTVITNVPISSYQPDLACGFFLAESNYVVEIDLDQTPPVSTSVWLHWLQSYKDNGQ